MTRNIAVGRSIVNIYSPSECYAQQKIQTFLIIPLLLSACTSSGEIYDSSKHDEEDFDLGNTMLLAWRSRINYGAAGADSGGEDMVVGMLQIMTGIGIISPQTVSGSAEAFKQVSMLN